MTVFIVHTCRQRPNRQMAQWLDSSSPSALLQHVSFGDGGDCESLHRAGALLAGLEQDLGIVVMSGRADYGAGAALGFFWWSKVDRVGHEDAGTDENGLGAELTHERSVGGSGNAAGRKVWHRQLASFGYNAHQLIGGAEILGGGIKLFLAKHREPTHLFHDLAHVFHRMDDVTGSGFTLGPDHGCAFGDAAQSLAQITGATDKRDLEGMLVNVVLFVGRRQDLGLIDVVNTDLLKNLSLGEVSDTALGHNGNRNGGHNLADLLDRGHAGDAAFSTDLGRDALERH